MLPGMKLLVTGLGLLLLSLLLTVALPDAEVSPRGLAVLGWLEQTSLFVGSGLVVAGAVLHALRPAEDPVRQPRGQDWFA